MKDFIVGLFTELSIQVKKLSSELEEKIDLDSEVYNKFKAESILLLNELYNEILTYLKNVQDEIPGLEFYHLLNYNPLFEEYQNLEQYRYQPAVRYNHADAKLNRLIHRIYYEINPLHSPPFITAISNSDQYYWAFPEYGIIAVPLGEEKSLINLPDLYHEISHFIYDNYSAIFSEIINKLVSDYFNEEIERVDEEGRDPSYKQEFSDMADKWKESWVEEFVCDMIATFLVGPAYGWTNFKISAYSSGYDKIYIPSEEHPSDESRMKVIFYLLQEMNNVNGIEKLKSAWSNFKIAVENPKPLNYEKCFPPSLLKSIAKNILLQLNAMGLRSFQQQISEFNNPVILYLNEAWNKLLSSPDEFSAWEANAISDIFNGSV